MPQYKMDAVEAHALETKLLMQILNPNICNDCKQAHPCKCILAEWDAQKPECTCHYQDDCVLHNASTDWMDAQLYY